MQSRQRGARCYTCNDRGHHESQCPNNFKTTKGGRLRYAQPAIELTIKGLQRVLVCDREEVEFEVRAYGLEVTVDALRIVHHGDKVSFFGTPTRNREFAVVLPNTDREIRMRWSERELVIDRRFHITEDSLRTDLSLPEQGAPEIEFAVSCESETAYDIEIDLFLGNRVDNYKCFIDGRRQMVVVPLFVAEHMEMWMQSRERRDQGERAEQTANAIESVVAELIDGVAASQMNDTVADTD